MIHVYFNNPCAVVIFISALEMAHVLWLEKRFSLISEPVQLTMPAHLTRGNVQAVSAQF